MTRNHLIRATLALTILIGVWLRASHVLDEHRLTPNERAYVYYAAQVHDGGIAVVPSLFNEYKNDPQLWAVAQPVRIGYIFILAGAMEAMGSTKVEAGMALSFGASVLTLLLVAWLGFRFFNPAVSLAATALCATAFTEIWLVRGTPEDGVFGLFGLIQIWLTFEIMRSPSRRWLYLLFHLFGMYAVTVKQSGVFIYGFCAIWLMGYLFFRLRQVTNALIMAAVSLGGLAIVCLFYVALAGSADTAWRVFTLSFSSNAEAWSYNEECCFGPWTQMPRVLFLLSPLTFVLSVAGIFAVAVPARWIPSRTDEERSRGAVCAIMAIGFVCLFGFFSGMQVLRFITPGEGPACLLAGMGVACLLATAQRYLASLEYRILTGFVTACFIAGMVRDYSIFTKAGAANGIPELGAILVRSALGR